MLKRMEIWNFESHKHTVLDDFSGALNLLCGESNSGKTSIVRALKLVAYNEFDPRSVRVGAKTCKVLVESDRGTVIVERGKKVNNWEVTKKGGKTESFDKVGVAIVPQAAEVIGLKMVSLGDVDVPVNIMDQLESHFMLASVGGDKASGSMRAQIVDEISGLSGIEGVIKDVSLDRHRAGREVKKIEDDMNETISKLHDEDRIADDEKIVLKAKELIDDEQECLELAEQFNEMHNEHSGIVSLVNDLESELSKMPDQEKAKTLSYAVDGCLNMAGNAEKVSNELNQVNGEIGVLEKDKAELDKFGDPSKSLKACEKALESAEKAENLIQEASEVTKQVKTREDRLSGIKDPSEAIKRAQDDMVAVEVASEVLDDVSGVMDEISGLEGELKDINKSAADAKKELEEVLSDVKVCPLTLGPVSDECMKEARG